MSALVVGLGVTGAAMVEGLVARGTSVVVVDDSPTDASRRVAAALGVHYVERPGPTELAILVDASTLVLPSPGVPDHHPVFDVADAASVPIHSEFDLAREWDDRPVLAITGTDGKTTVTTLVREMLEASGVRAAAVGNTETPLVTALGDADVQVFVVEASSFRLAHTERFTPAVATWLNFGPDHQDAHRTLGDYERAKARIWRDQPSTAVAVANADDDVVARHLRSAPARHVTFGLGGDADFTVVDGELATPDESVAKITELWHAFPHDIANALAAIATALPGGATVDGCRTALLAFEGLPHRVSLVGDHGGVRWYDDSKATAPHATLAALRAFDSVVLIAGGRNKGLDLSALAAAASRLRAVVAIGEAADDVSSAFGGLLPTAIATSMDDAVARAAAFAEPGDAVLLSPACASFDWYANYGERGDDFVRAVNDFLGNAA